MRVAALSSQPIAEVARALSRAFLDNPATLALIPDPPRRRLGKLSRVMYGFVQATRRCGWAQVATDGERVCGAMLCFGPASLPLGAAAYAWMAYGPLSAGIGTAVRYALADRLLKQLHPSDPHWYLFVLGVEPEEQGRGVGSALLRTLTERADHERVGCYLETDKASSVRLYERHGFRVEHDETEPRLGVRFWTMRR